MHSEIRCLMKSMVNMKEELVRELASKILVQPPPKRKEQLHNKKSSSKLNADLYKKFKII